jgi:hypothetical protein
VLVLNHTNEELDLEPESPSLEHGQWMDTPESRPPTEILSGESGMLRCKSSHMYAGIEGSVTYRVVGYSLTAFARQRISRSECWVARETSQLLSSYSVSWPR